jgi:cytoskeletal protein CcmA (bactofilin family)
MRPKIEAATGLEHGPAIDKPRTIQHMPSIIAEGFEIVGDLTAEAEIQVDGTVRGNLKANHVIIGRSGLVDGSIEAERATIDGTIFGDTNTKTAALEANARIKGAITVSGDMSMAVGARLEGNVAMKHAAPSGGQDADNKRASAKPNGDNKPDSGKAYAGRPAA